MGLRDQWYENAIFYCLDVETYADSDGDGIGDFTGLTRRLDYLCRSRSDLPLADALLPVAQLRRWL